MWFRLLIINVIIYYVSRIIGFDHRKSVLSQIPSANECPENIMINVNHEKSSSRAVYEYFTDKHKDIKTSNVRI